MQLKVLYNNTIGYCIPNDAINILIKRHCGIKIHGYWLINQYEIFYLMNYNECIISFQIDKSLQEMHELNQNTLQWINDPVIFLNSITIDANKLCAYIHIRNKDLFLRYNISSKIYDEIKTLPTKKICKDQQFQFKPIEYEYILYENLQDYKQDINGINLQLLMFNDNLVEQQIEQNGVIGLMENGDINLIKIIDFK